MVRFGDAHHVFPAGVVQPGRTATTRSRLRVRITPHRAKEGYAEESLSP